MNGIEPLVQAGDGENCVIATPRGAQVLGWSCRGQQRLYLSPRARAGAGQAIRGGIPVIFPQFGAAGPGRRHGFARLAAWTANTSSPTRLSMHLAANDETQDEWPHAFEAAVEVIVGPDELQICLDIENRDSASFTFTCALHSYLRVSNVETTIVTGLQGVEYRDATTAGTTRSELAPRLAFQGEVDRIYLDPPAILTLDDGAHRLQVEQAGFRDTVIWNPGRELGDGMADLGHGEYRRFVCIEAATVAVPIQLEPGERWSGRQAVRVLY